MPLAVPLQIIIYHDESYVNTRHSSKFNWVCTDSEISERLVGHYFGNKMGTGTGVGARLILVHAVSKYGLLSKTGKHVVDRDTTAKMVTEDTSELLFPANSGRGDYHDNMDGDTWELWVTRRLVPAFKACYPNKRMILCLDNAPYHVGTGKNAINTNIKTKSHLIHQLFTVCGTKAFFVERKNGPVFFAANTEEDWLPTTTKSNPTPTVEELLKQIKLECKINPALKNTRLDELASEHQFDYILTPPYTPNLQPIETVWAAVKNDIASKYTSDRGIPLLKQQTFTAFEKITAKTVSGILTDKTLPFANKLIEKIDGLSGTIDNLVVS